MKIKKGDIVKFKDKEAKTQYGVVERGGKRPKIICGGGKWGAEGAASLFTVVEGDVFSYLSKEEKDSICPMDDWSVEEYQKIEGHDDSEAFKAFIYFQGEKVLKASNSGFGGLNNYKPIKDRKYLDLFFV